MSARNLDHHHRAFVDGLGGSAQDVTERGHDECGLGGNATSGHAAVRRSLSGVLLAPPPTFVAAIDVFRGADECELPAAHPAGHLDAQPQADRWRIRRVAAPIRQDGARLVGGCFRLEILVGGLVDDCHLVAHVGLETHDGEDEALTYRKGVVRVDRGCSVPWSLNSAPSLVSWAAN